MPSATTAFRSRLSPATWTSTSAPVERPSAPSRAGSTSGRAFRNAIAPSTSLGQPQPQAFCGPRCGRGRGSRRAARRSRGGRACERARPLPRRSLPPPWTTITVAPLRVGRYQPESLHAVAGLEGHVAVGGARRGADVARATCASRSSPMLIGTITNSSAEQRRRDGDAPALPAALAAMHATAARSPARRAAARGRGQHAVTSPPETPCSAMCLTCIEPLTVAAAPKTARAPPAARSHAGRPRPRQARRRERGGEHVAGRGARRRRRGQCHDSAPPNTRSRAQRRSRRHAQGPSSSEQATSRV